MASPDGRVPLSLDPGLESIELLLVSVLNPDLQSFVLRVVLETSTDGRIVSVDLGTLSPFPADQPGTFAMPLSDQAKRFLGATSGHVELVAELLPADAARPLVPPIEVVVGVAGLAN